MTLHLTSFFLKYFKHRFLMKFLISIKFPLKWVVTWHVLKILLIQHISNRIWTNWPHFRQENQFFLDLPITVFHVLKSNQVYIKVHTQLPWASTLLQMIKQMVVDFYWNLMLACWVWILRALTQLREVKGLQDCCKTLEMGI